MYRIFQRGEVIFSTDYPDDLRQWVREEAVPSDFVEEVLAFQVGDGLMLPGRAALNEICRVTGLVTMY